MASDLSNYKSGTEVTVKCFRLSCEHITYPVVLQKEELVPADFRGYGRFLAKKPVAAKIFTFVGKNGSSHCSSLTCPGCGNWISRIAIMPSDNGGGPKIFGLESDQ